MAMSERARLVSSDKKDPAVITLHRRIVARLSAFLELESESGGLALLLLVPWRYINCDGRRTVGAHGVRVCAAPAGTACVGVARLPQVHV